MRRLNLRAAEVRFDDDDPEGYHTAYRRVGPAVGGSLLGGSLYELPSGQSICPYHYEYGNEEWLIVVDGRPLLRHPGGEDVLEPGDVVCFPVGPAGAHKVTNPGADRVRVLVLSTKHEVSVAVYPDSDKIGIWPGDERDEVIVRRESAVGYWDREA